jgi:hypothetical protein
LFICGVPAALRGQKTAADIFLVNITFFIYNQYGSRSALIGVFPLLPLAPEPYPVFITFFFTDMIPVD